MSVPAEPNATQFSHPVVRLFAATRPAFLSVTLMAVLLGFASAVLSGYGLAMIPATLTLVFALVAHAGANVLNDYYDAKNGCDFAESERIFPYTGGSRFIQNGILSQRFIGCFGAILLLCVIPAGLWLAWHSASGLLLIGMAGLFIGWAYSAPPFQLQARGLGEFGITAGWLLVVGKAIVFLGCPSLSVWDLRCWWRMCCLSINFPMCEPIKSRTSALSSCVWVQRAHVGAI